MLSCNYYYKGHLIGNEMLLNDFLLSKQKLYSKLGDIVFNHNNRFSYAMSKIQGIKNGAHELSELYNKAKAKSVAMDVDDILYMERPYVGVTEFLAAFRNENDRRLFPEFIEENYWSNRYYDWAKGEFTQDEIELFFDGDESRKAAIDLGNPNDWRDNNNILKSDFGTDIQKKYRDKMKAKWKALSEFGNELHNILQAYFSYIPGSEKVMWFSALKDGSKTDEDLYNYLLNKGKITSHTDLEKTKQTIKYAKDLLQELESLFGDKCYYFPEFTIYSELNLDFTDAKGRTTKAPKLLGRIDLLVLDQNGVAHIVDYKTSPKSYLEYHSSKELAFTYQLLTYERMLRRWGLNTLKTKVFVAPLKLNNVHLNSAGVWEYESVSRGNNKIDVNGVPSVVENITDSRNNEKIADNLDEFMSAPLEIDGNAEELIQNTDKTMVKFFGKYGAPKKRTIDEVKSLIEDQKGFEINPETNKFEFRVYGSNRLIQASSEAELVDKVMKHFENQQGRFLYMAESIKNVLLEGLANDTENVEFPAGTSDWMRNILSKYCSKEWQIVDNDATNAALQYGMIFLENKATHIIDIVKLTNHDPKKKISFGKNRTTLLGGLDVDDMKENSNSQSLALDACYGNISMIEAMVVLNNLHFNNEVKLNKIQILSPFANGRKGAGLTASNKLLLYNYKKLRALANEDSTDQFDLKNGTIKMTSYIQQCYFEFQDIMNRISDSPSGKYKELSQAKDILARPAMSELYSQLLPTRVEETLKDLAALSKILEEKYNMSIDVDNTGNSIHTNFESYQNQYAKTLYQCILQAMLELKGVDLKQQIQDCHQWIDSVNVLQKGLSGLMLDNSKNFANGLMNKISDLILTSVQNARDIAYKRIRQTRDKTEDLKKSSNFSGIVEHTIGNQTSLYDGMTYFDKTTKDLLFINPWKKPSSKKMEYLKYVITEINKDRYSGLSDAQIQEKIQNDDVEYFRVPLMEATFASRINTDGWLVWLKNKLKLLNPKNLIKRAEEYATEYFSQEQENQAKKDVEIFKAVNLFDQGLSSNRLDIIQEKIASYGEGYFERDLERILQNHIWAYAVKNATDERMPLIKAAYVSLAIAGNLQNLVFKDTMDFYQKYIRSKVLHQSIVDDKFKFVQGLSSMLKQGASWMALAFAPVLLYQNIEGIWKDAKLIITKPDGTLAFTAQNMKDSLGIVYQELFNGSDNNTVCRALNASYGINDMDARSFAENNSSNNHGLFNFMSKFAFKMVSRPDFYNRMTIFVSQMKHDGSFEAHSIKNNQLVYDWKKDKRFAAYANNDKSNMEAYNKAKALYYATAEQLVREGAVDENGDLFTISDEDSKPNALPKAYSNTESEAMKAIGDIMYGYYDSTKESLFHSTILGGMLGLMKKFWSSKKNQYLAPGGHKAQGRWEQMVNPEGDKMFYAKKDDGSIDRNAPLVTENDEKCSKIPFMQWTGRWEEGVVQTLTDVILESAQSRSNPISVWNKKIADADEEVAKAYKSNMKLLLSDLLLWVLLGSLASIFMAAAQQDATEAKKTGHFEDAAHATFTGLLAKMFKNSTLDFNWISAIGDVSIDWQPFSLSVLGREAKYLGNIITGDESFADAVVKSFSATRSVKPMFDFILRDDD